MQAACSARLVLLPLLQLPYSLPPPPLPPLLTPPPQQERAQARRLQETYKRCFELAAQYHADGKHDLAHELRQQGAEYRRKHDEERRRASRRISTRV